MCFADLLQGIKSVFKFVFKEFQICYKDKMFEEMMHLERF